MVFLLLKSKLRWREKKVKQYATAQRNILKSADRMRKCSIANKRSDFWDFFSFGMALIAYRQTLSICYFKSLFARSLNFLLLMLYRIIFYWLIIVGVTTTLLQQTAARRNTNNNFQKIQRMHNRQRRRLHLNQSQKTIFAIYCILSAVSIHHSLSQSFIAAFLRLCAFLSYFFEFPHTFFTFLYTFPQSFTLWPPFAF